jgi:hypothetical protein
MGLCGVRILSGSSDGKVRMLRCRDGGRAGGLGLRCWVVEFGVA